MRAGASVGTRVRQWPMTGVSYMIPFAAAGGVLAGLLALWISRWRVPKGVRGVVPVVVTPLLSSALVGLVMFVLIGQPIASLMAGLTNWLNGLSGANLVVMGALLGAMMGFDFGGPVNKVAYTFAVTGLATEGLTDGAAQYRVMAAVMAAGMVAPLLSSVVGSDVTGALTMACGAGLPAPHGGDLGAPADLRLARVPARRGGGDGRHGRDRRRPEEHALGGRGGHRRTRRGRDCHSPARLTRPDPTAACTV